MNKKPGNPRPPAKPGKSNVVSIVPDLTQKRVKQMYAEAATKHLRQLESEAALRESEAAIEDMDFEAAITWCENESSREARESWAEMRSLRAFQSCLRGNTEAGLAEWDEVIAAEPKIAATYLLRSAWLKRTDVAAALADAERAVGAEPTNPTAYARRGDYHRMLGDGDRAIADYRRALSLDSELYDVHFGLGTVFASLGRFQEARSAYTRAIRLAPRYVEFYLARAAALEQLGDFKGAVGDCDRILELDPSREDIRTQRRVYELRAAGDHMAAARVMVEATEGILEMLGDEPEAQEIFTTIGSMQLTVGERDKALVSFNRALGLNPEDVKALGKRGMIYWDTEEFASSLADFDHAVRLAPDNTDHHYGRSRALAKLGRFDDAVQAASRAIELAPDKPDAYQLRAIYQSHADPKATAKVKADFRRLWELMPKEAAFRTQYIDYLESIGEVDEAITAFDKALALEPDSAELLYARAACKIAWDETRYSAGINDEEDEPEANKEARITSAIADLERALVLGKRDEDVYWQLIKAGEVRGCKGAKYVEIDRAIEALPDFVMALAMRESWRRCDGDLEGAASDHARTLALGFVYRED